MFELASLIQKRGLRPRGINLYSSEWAKNKSNLLFFRTSAEYMVLHMLAPPPAIARLLILSDRQWWAPRHHKSTSCFLKKTKSPGNTKDYFLISLTLRTPHWAYGSRRAKGQGTDVCWIVKTSQKATSLKVKSGFKILKRLISLEMSRLSLTGCSGGTL